MRKSFALGLLASAAFAAAAHAQASYPCVNDAPNPYRLVRDWSETPRPWASPLGAAVDAAGDLWVFDRCEDAGCAESRRSPIFRLGPDGRTKANFGAGLFVFPHGIAVGRDGSVWAVDGDVKDGRGNQVFKLSPEGRVLMRLGRAGEGEGSSALDVFDQPTAVAVASNGDVFVAEGHAPRFGNSRIMKFDGNGAFIRAFGRLGSGDGELREPHAIALDSMDRLFVADRRNSRVVIFDRDGNFLAAWRQFGRPSGIAISNDVLYTIDSQSTDTPGPNSNPGCRPGIRVGSVRDGRVTAFIPAPLMVDGRELAPEGIAAAPDGTIYAVAQSGSDVLKFVRN